MPESCVMLDSGPGATCMSFANTLTPSEVSQPWSTLCFYNKRTIKQLMLGG